HLFSFPSSFADPVDARANVVLVHRATGAGSVRRGRITSCCWRRRATDAPHAEPLRPRTTHRPTPRRGDGARIPRSVSPAPSPPGGARGTSPLLPFLCCSCFVGDV